MPTFSRHYLRILCWIWLLLCVSPVQAAPYFYLEGDNIGATSYNETWQLKLATGEDLITAAQTIIHFNATILYPLQVSTVNSRCSFWAPADPSLGLGNGASPYFSGGNKVVVSCGFSNPGFQSYCTGTDTPVDCDLILSLTMKPISSGSAEFSFSNQQFRYIGTTVTPGYAPPFDLEVYGSTVEAEQARPTPRPTATPSATPVPSSAPAAPSPDTLRASDLTLVEIGSNGTGTRTTTPTNNDSVVDPNLEVVTEDNMIPPPPADLELRPAATPFIISSSSESAQPDGEVLSIQSLRELLIPGKSQADRTLVLFNLISTLTFVTLLALLVWRMIVSSRTNQLKYRHMSDILEGELSVIESKLAGAGVESSGKSMAVGERSLDDLKKEIESSR